MTQLPPPRAHVPDKDALLLLSFAASLLDACLGQGFLLAYTAISTNNCITIQT